MSSPGAALERPTTVGLERPTTVGLDRRVPVIRVEVATDRCKGCELCVGACPKHVLALDRSTVNALGHHPVHVLDQDACTSCVLCARICPDSVFTIYAPPRGGVR